MNPMEDNSKSEISLEGSKVRMYPERISAWLRGEHIAPITIDMALTRACNYRCEYCYSVLQENESKGRLSWKILKGFVDDCAKMDVKGISLVSDGESTIHPNYVNFIEYVHAKRIAIALGTNGSLLTLKALRRILPCLSYLRFNISAGVPLRYSEIMGTDPNKFDTVVRNITDAVDIKRAYDYKCTIGMQMVFRPEYADQVLPLAELAVQLGVDYLVIKHCSDDEKGTLGVCYEEYRKFHDLLRQAERMSTPYTTIQVKWRKIEAGDTRSYRRCFGPPFILQMSGSGLVAPCGMLFGDAYKEYHIGNIKEERFYHMWQGHRYWQVMDRLASPQLFNAQTMCGCLCLQHHTNEELDTIIRNGGQYGARNMCKMHKEFI